MSWERSAASRQLSSLACDELLRVLFESEAEALSSVATEVDRISRFVDEAAARVEVGGRLHVAAAGSSAHLVRYAVDEAESWFPGVLPLGVLAGGAEGSEEDAVARVEDSVRPDDAVLGVSRSGARLWTCTVMRKANMTGSLTASLSCVASAPITRESDIPIVVPTGAEVVVGCTQYRAGTIVKVALDGILLALAARLGGLWGDVPVRARVGADAWRIVAAATGLDPLQARSVLASSEGDALAAIVMSKLGIGLEEAGRRLADSNRGIRAILGDP